MRTNDPKIIWVIAIVLVLLAGYRYFDQAKSPIADQPAQPKLSQDNAARNSKAAKGKLAPEIILNDLNGQTVKLSDYRGKVVILNFWASWCPPCKAEMPELNKAAQEFAKGVDAVLITVNLTDGTRETVDKAQKYISDNKYSMTVLLDTQGRAASAYSVNGIPTTCVIDKQGVVIDYIVGETTKDALTKYVNQLK